MSKSITLQYVNEELLKENNYFLSLIYQAATNNLLSQTELQSLKQQSYIILAKQCNKYTGLQSTSISVDNASEIMQSNMYVIGVYLKSLASTELALQALRNKALEKLHEKGKQQTYNKFAVAKQFYKLAMKNRITTPNYTYNATLSNNGIGLFFKQYDYEFAAHHIPASIDYQLSNHVFEYVGVEFIIKYLQNIIIENEFCSYFEAQVIHNLLKGYREDYQDLLLNIYEQVLTNALACSLLNKNILSLKLLKDEVIFIEQMLSKQNYLKIEFYLKQACEKLIVSLNIKNQDLINYLFKSLKNITVYVKNSLLTKTLNEVFVQMYQENHSVMVFEDNITLSTTKFQDLLKEILRCQLINDKVQLIKDNVKSLKDLQDILLNAYFKLNEVKQVLSILSETELAILIKRNNLNKVNGMRELNEAEQILQQALINYIRELSIETQRTITKLTKTLKDTSYDI
ncbi:hypothetical protein IMX26_15945 [Clostridium sp. 'deep sea']|uniref:DUF6179 domain-containing protein n=1 Tax=Clostridium sp. 'deep sea' TaxID=2779445 RepID=UPI001896A197|nr:DUF6179 domain-containing protein [Clostridium sp. 'deep sea']QOR34930.1 hypothetical protein IMX26_15945 [Clostridium sp. 'deep sea']